MHLGGCQVKSAEGNRFWVERGELIGERTGGFTPRRKVRKARKALGLLDGIGGFVNACGRRRAGGATGIEFTVHFVIRLQDYTSRVIDHIGLVQASTAHALPFTALWRPV
jgi:hypothetical protein